MPKLWFNIGGISLVIAFLVYADHVVRLHASWRWEDFFHHETFIVLFGCVCVVFWLIALSEKIKGVGRGRKGKSRSNSQGGSQ